MCVSEGGGGGGGEFLSGRRSGCWTLEYGGGVWSPSHLVTLQSVPD